MLPWIVLPIPIASGFAMLSERLAGISLPYSVLMTSAVVPMFLVVVYWGYGLLLSRWIGRTGRDLGEIAGEEWRHRELRWWDRGGV